MDSIDNVVAFGLVYEDEELNNSVHGAPMQAGCIRVSVDGIINGDALVPVPVHGEIEKVHQAVGSQLAWPRDLVIFPSVSKMVCISSIFSQFVYAGKNALYLFSIFWPRD